MTRPRSILRGGTDYTCVSLEDILGHFKEWRESTNALIRKLTSLKSKAIKSKKNIDHVDDVIDFINLSIDLFGRFLFDWDRLLAEIPEGVTEAHIEMLTQIIKRSEHHEKACVNFKHDHIEKELRDESMRFLLDAIYADTRNEIINYTDLHNVIPRLQTYLGRKLKEDKNRTDTGGQKMRQQVTQTLTHIKTSETWSQIEKDYDVSKRSFARKINFVSDGFKRKIIFRDIEQSYMLAAYGFSKPAVILAGSVIEELLRLYLKHKNIKPTNNNFDSYIKTCDQNGLLKLAINRLTDSVRHFRNVVHLEKENSPRISISKATAKGAVASIFTIANDFKKNT